MSLLTGVRLAVGVALARLLVMGVAVVVAGCLAAPALAGGGDIAASDYFPVFGPRLSGETVLWTVPRRDRGYVMKRGSASSGARRSVLTMRSRRDRAVALRWVASPQEVLVQQRLVDTRADGGDVLAIDLDTARLLPGGELEPLAPGKVESVGNFDLDGSVGVFPGEQPGTALVRDFSQPSSMPMRIEGTGFGLTVAGRYLAWFAGEAIVVYDYMNMTELYRLTPPTPGALEIQADGKVAFTYDVLVRGGVQRRVGWASPSEPFLHELPLSPSPEYGLKLRGDVVVFERDEGTLAQTVQGELGYVPLSGGEAKILARSVETASATDDLFDFDGRQVAWLDRTCSGARVRVAELADLIASPRRARAARCRLRLAARPRLTRQGDLRLGVSCVGFRRDCSIGGATLRLARGYRVGNKRFPRGTRLFAKRRRHGDDPPATARFKISPQTRRLLRRPGPLRLTVTVHMGDPDFSERRRSTVAVR